MQLSTKKLREFQRLVKENTGKDISLEEAQEQGEALLLLMKTCLAQANQTKMTVRTKPKAEEVRRRL